MENVILCGCSAAERRIVNSLASYAAVQYFGENSIRRCGEGEKEIVVCSVPQLPRTENLPGVLVLGSELKKRRFPLRSLLFPVFDSGSKTAADLLSLNQGAAISCGTSPRDTLSLASISEQKAVISLQRSLYTLSGDLVEPRDITVRLCRDCSVFEIMAFCAVILLCGVSSEQELILN